MLSVKNLIRLYSAGPYSKKMCAIPWDTAEQSLFLKEENKKGSRDGFPFYFSICSALNRVSGRSDKMASAIRPKAVKNLP